MTDTARLKAAFRNVLIGVNHIANWRADNWPAPGTDHAIAREILGGAREYDMWCCWNAAMCNRDALEDIA